MNRLLLRRHGTRVVTRSTSEGHPSLVLRVRMRRSSGRVISTCGFLAVLATCALADDRKATETELPPAASGAIEFERDIRPIFVRACLKCHDAAKQKSGLRLDDGEAALKGGNSGPAFVPGKPLESRLLRVVAGLDPELTMPPGKDALSREELGRLRAWIEQGAKWSARSNGQAATKLTSNHWAFQAPMHPPAPMVPPTQWVRTPIDAFILARLEREQIPPSQEADRGTLIRRLSLDLLGLPPTPEQVDAFLHDSSPTAYESLVDRLLASPHYGERWGRHWLDLARYADSDGYEKDGGRPNAWRYRSWVIDAFNRDLPYDQFTIEQLAGDLLPNASPDQKIATGFHRNTLTNREGGVDREQFRVEAVIDRVNTTAKVFLGLTLGCAQCHDHKYDPLSQREYYQFFAFFNSDEELDLPVTRGAEYHAYLKKKELFDQVKVAKDAKRKPPAPPLAQTLGLGKLRKTHILIRGDFLRPGVEVEPGTLVVLEPSQTHAKNRLDLARWIASERNPLTARVFVNWVWQHYFGRGLVATLEDFGAQGEKPSHPELLDWLATEFMRHRWSIRSLHRLIVTSAVYQQVSEARPELLRRDPLNVLLARQARPRLEAEVVRDCALATSGLLAPRIGGPSVHPPQPAGISDLTYAGSAKWVESRGADRYRRGLYTWFQRTSPYPMLMTFDAPDSNVCCVRRDRSNTPLQALTLLNDAVFVEAARALARRVIKEASEPEARLRRAFQLCVSREPTSSELAVLTNAFDEFREQSRQSPEQAVLLTGDAIARPTPDSLEFAAWVALARMLLNLDEFVVRD